MRGTTPIRILFMVGVLFIVCSRCEESTAASTAESVTARLAGEGQREWVVKQWVSWLNGGSRQCESGESWIFTRDGKGVRKICENGIVHQQNFQWTWAGVQDGLPVLKVDENRYIAEFRQLSSEGDLPTPVTILRTLRTSQTEPVEEIQLVLKDQ